jgi:hypothetical protein
LRLRFEIEAARIAAAYKEVIDAGAGRGSCDPAGGGDGCAGVRNVEPSIRVNNRTDDGAVGRHAYQFAETQGAEAVGDRSSTQRAYSKSLWAAVVSALHSALPIRDPYDRISLSANAIKPTFWKLSLPPSFPFAAVDPFSFSPISALAFLRAS